MNEELKQAYKEKYAQAKAKGVKFYPDIIYKDALVAFAIFLLMIGLAAFIGVASEPKADPNDTTYIPRPEWYFLCVYQYLKLMPSELLGIDGKALGIFTQAQVFSRQPGVDRNFHYTYHRYWSTLPPAVHRP